MRGLYKQLHNDINKLRIEYDCKSQAAIRDPKETSDSSGSLTTDSSLESSGEEERDLVLGECKECLESSLRLRKEMFPWKILMGTGFCKTKKRVEDKIKGIGKGEIQRQAAAN